VPRQRSQHSELDADVYWQSEAIPLFLKSPQYEFFGLCSSRFGVGVPFSVVLVRIPVRLSLPANEPPCGREKFRDSVRRLSSLHEGIRVARKVVPVQVCGVVRVVGQALLQKRPEVLEQGLLVLDPGAKVCQLLQHADVVRLHPQ
jgi:hypothetical protein